MLSHSVFFSFTLVSAWCHSKDSLNQYGGKTAPGWRLSLSAIPVSAYQSWGQTLAKFGRPDTYPCGQEAGSEKMKGNFVGKLKKQYLLLANIENYLKKELYLI